MKSLCTKISFSCMEITMHENDIFMHENDIKMQKNVNFVAEIFMDESSMHETVHSLSFHEHFLGDKDTQGNFGGEIFIFMHGNLIVMHEIFLPRFFHA